MATEAKMEVTGQPEGTTLLQAIQKGAISKPTLMGFNEFETWRKETGGRPTTATDGASTSSATEASIWKEVMAELYGVDWRDKLASQKDRKANGGASAADSEADGLSVVGGSDADPLGGQGTPGPPNIGSAAAVPVGEIRGGRPDPWDPEGKGGSPPL